MSGPLIFLKARQVGASLLSKAHIKGYTRADGTTVKGYDTKHFAAPAPKLALKFPPSVPVVAASEKPAPAPAPKPAQAGLFHHGEQSYFQQKWGMAKPSLKWPGKSEPPKPKAWHPKLNDNGQKVGLLNPHKASDAAAWADPLATATVPAGGAAPAELHGVPFAPWVHAPTTLEEWDEVEGQDHSIDEPDFDCPHDREAAAGVVIQEPDGRVWLVSPSNAFGGYRNTFPKGRADDGLSLQATAIKEAFEESGLQVQITGFLGDFERTQTFTRYYLAKRVGGTPTDAGWESQAVRLAPYVGLEGLLNGAADKPVREALTAAAGV